jgi:hypothetical protein
MLLDIAPQSLGDHFAQGADLVLQLFESGPQRAKLGNDQPQTAAEQEAQ